jgi:hypothetical protein
VLEHVREVARRNPAAELGAGGQMAQGQVQLQLRRPQLRAQLRRRRRLRRLRTVS